LLWALRDQVALTGTKYGCGTYNRIRAAIHKAAELMAKKGAA
jgi:aerobic-type carbon monoxide dehydrogenase small subunit (CoxS/CutS family)